MKRTPKGMCVFANFWENYEHRWLERATDRLQIIQGSKITRDFWLKQKLSQFL